VTTNELAANSVTAANLAIGTIANTLTNPGFEASAPGAAATQGGASTIAGWAVNAWGGTGASALVVGPASGSAHEGKNWLIFTVGSSTNVNIQSDPFPVSGGGTIAGSYWSYGNGLMGLDWYDNADAYISSSAVASTTGSGWLQDLGYAVVPSNAASARATLGAPSTSANFSYDDVSIVLGGVVIDSTGVYVYNGKLTVTNGASTVIIDGTHDMFKIVASGTSTKTGCNGSGVACVVTDVLDINTGLTYSPAHLDFLGAVAGRAETLPRTVIINTAGGGVVADHMRVFQEWIAGDHTQVTFSWETGFNRSGSTYTWRYYILVEASV
jgi:hypothetical protein